MLLKQRILGWIARGEINVAFRRWWRPTVKANGRLETSAGDTPEGSISLDMCRYKIAL